MKPSNITQYCLYSIIICHIDANSNTKSASNDSMSMSEWVLNRNNFKLENDNGSLLYSPVSDAQNTSRLQSVNQSPLQELYNYSQQSFGDFTSQMSKNELATFKPLNELGTRAHGFHLVRSRVESNFNFSWVNTDKPKFDTKNECYVDNEALIPHYTNNVAMQRKIINTRCKRY